MLKGLLQDDEDLRFEKWWFFWVSGEKKNQITLLLIKSLFYFYVKKIDNVGHLRN